MMFFVACADEVIRKRLLVDGEGVSNDDRRINSLAKMVIKWLNTKDSAEEDSDGGYQRMLFALEQCDFSFGKTQMVIDMNKAEMTRYKALSVDIEQGIGECQDNICTAREQLKSAIEIRRNRQQYDSLARVIQQHPDRVKTQEEIGTLQQELDQLTQTRDELIGKLELRKRQFHLLVHSIHELQQLLDEEQNEEEGRAEGRDDMEVT